MIQPWKSPSIASTVLYRLDQSQTYVGPGEGNRVQLFMVSGKIPEEYVGVDIITQPILESTICYNILLIGKIKYIPAWKAI